MRRPDWKTGNRAVYRDVLHPSYRVLLVGCGTGRDLIELVRLGCEVVGLEQSPMLAGRARAHLGRLGLAGTRGRGACGIVRDRRDRTTPSFSRSTCIPTSSAPRPALRSSHARARTLSPHGRIILSYATIQPQSPVWISLARISSVCSGSDWWPHRGDRLHGPASQPEVLNLEHQFSPDEIARECDAAGLRVIRDEAINPLFRFAIAGRVSAAASAITASHTSPSRRSLRGNTSRRIGMSLTSRDAMANWFARRDRSTWIRLKAARITSRNASSPPSGTMVTRDALPCSPGRQAHTAIRSGTSRSHVSIGESLNTSFDVPAIEPVACAARQYFLRDRGEQLQPGRAGVRGPHSVSLLEREHVVGQEVKAARDESGPDRRLAVPAVAQKSHGLPVDHHRRGMQRLPSERQQREGQNLTEQVRRQRFLRPLREPAIGDRAAVRGDEKFEEVLPAQIRRTVGKPAALEPISGRWRQAKAAAGVVESMRGAGAKPHIRPAACGDSRAGEGNRAFEREAVESISRGDPDHAFAPLLLVLGLPWPSFELPPLAAVSLRKSPCTFSVGERYGCFAGDGSSLRFHALSC